MGKSLYIAEKPSVAQEFAKALHVNSVRKDGYLESEDSVVTWCVGHLVTMSYPEVYDEKYKRWSLATLPFIPEKFLYEVIPSVKKQFQIVSGLLKRKDVDAIYVCTDSGREGEYIYRLVEQMAGVKGKVRKRVWIDSQTEEEILHGIQTAKDLSEYDNLASSAYLRAKEDYLMGINFSRLLSLKYGNAISNYLGTRYTVISVGRVMTCVLGMVVRREWEIRNFVKTPFYRVVATQSLGDGKEFPGEFRAVQALTGTCSPRSFTRKMVSRKRRMRKELIRILEKNQPLQAVLERMEKKRETKNRCFYNLAELQNECSRYLKISPDDAENRPGALRKKAGDLPREPMPEPFHGSVQGSLKISADLRLLTMRAVSCRRFWPGKLHKRSPPRAMSMISRSPTTTPLFPRVRGLSASGPSAATGRKFMR